MGAQMAGVVADERRWYVVEAREGKDFDVCLRLSAAGFDVWRPVDRVRLTERRNVAGSERIIRREVKRPRFGRYLFLRMEASFGRVFAISTAPGVVGFLCYAGGETPAPMPEGLVEFYRNHAPERAEEHVEIRVGATVRVVMGPFAGACATVESIDRRGMLIIGVALFGRVTPVPMEAGYVELLEQGPRPPTKQADKDRTTRRSSAHAH